MKTAAPRFDRLTVCAKCVQPDDERLGIKLSFTEITCARCNQPLESAIMVQRLRTQAAGPRTMRFTPWRTVRAVHAPPVDGTARGGLPVDSRGSETRSDGSRRPASLPEEGLSPKGCEAASHDFSSAYPDPLFDAPPAE
jgi:hypothetical protein